jgi:hypothetical protein
LVVLEIKEKQPVLHIVGVLTKNSLSSDHSAHLQWKSEKKGCFLFDMPPSNSDMIWFLNCLQKEQKGVQMLVDKNIMNIQVPTGKTISIPAAAAATDSTTTEPPSTEPSSTEPPSTEPPSKEQQAVSAVVAMNCFELTVDPKDYPTLDSKNICLQMDTDITPVLWDIMKLSKKVRSAGLIKVLHYNDTTTSLVEVPCSAK